MAFAGMLYLGVVRGEWLVAVAVIPGYYLGSMIDPDMDLARKNTSAKSMWRRSVLIRWITPWWTLYGHIARLFLGGHRSFLTHFPIISTLIRFLWLVVPIAALSALISPSITASLIQGPYVLKMLAGLLVGLCLSDLVHICADVI